MKWCTIWGLSKDGRLGGYYECVLPFIVISFHRKDAIRSAEAMNYLSYEWQRMCPEIMEMGTLSPDDAARACSQAKAHYLGMRPINHNSFYQYLRVSCPESRSTHL